MFTLVTLVAGLLSAAPAVAAGDPQTARELFRQGSVFFDSGQFAKAVELWQRAYEEKQDPTFLYNIGQAYRLAGDPRKALFFYKSFLRNAPTSPQRDDVEQKVAALQRQLSTADQQHPGTAGRSSAAASPQLTEPGMAAGRAGLTDRAAAPETHQLPGTPASAEAAPETAGATPAPSEPDRGRVTGDMAGAGTFGRDEPRDTVDRFDFGLAPGVAVWVAGPVGGKQSAFAATALLGFTFGEEDREARVRFRLGALFQYSAVQEPSATDTFIDVLIDPTLRVRAWEQRLYVSADVGLGILALAGLKPASVFLAHDENVMVSGAQSLFEVRPGLSVAFRLYPAVEIFAGPALAINPQKAHFHASIVRIELQGGAALRF